VAKESYKAPGIRQFLEDNFGRSTAIKEDKCIPPPTGCGGPAVDFRDELSRREYSISGLCQECQDLTFGGGE
jgi:hypothetical protein